MRYLAEFTEHYAITALWASNDPDGEPLDRDYTPTDLHPDTQAAFERDCAAFLWLSSGLIADLDRGRYVWGQAAHDFWLTRNGHGAGFWDGDYPEPHAALLTSISNLFGECDLEVGDDDAIHIL